MIAPRPRQSRAPPERIAVLEGATRARCCGRPLRHGRHAAGGDARSRPRVARSSLARRGDAKAPWFDASELRDHSGERKLGLGSSAAILVASLGALELDERAEARDDELADRVMPAAPRGPPGRAGGRQWDRCRGKLVRRHSFVSKRATARRRAPHHPGYLAPLGSSSRCGRARRRRPPRTCWRAWRRCATRGRRTTGVCSPTSSTRLARPPTRETRSRSSRGCREQLDAFTELGTLAALPIVTLGCSPLRRSREPHQCRFVPSGAGWRRHRSP